MKKVSAIVYHEHGEPPEAVRVEEQELSDPGPGEALVEIKAAPINPVDLNVIEGKYPVRPPLPAVAGVEGAGVVAAVCDRRGEPLAIKPGDHVLLPWTAGAWREACVVAAGELTVVPRDVPLEQAAMLRVNPPTAWRMLHDFVDLKPGDWVIQNAANSGVGRNVIQIARALGLRTVNVVRRAELIDELRAEGGDIVLAEGDELLKQIADATGGAKIPLGLNCVGGDSALRVANALAPGGTHVTYGAMARQPLRVPASLVIFKDLRFCGFWITQWMQRASAEEKRVMFEPLFDLARRGIVHTKVEKTYPLAQAREAIADAQRGGRAGKILFRMGSERGES
jgi:mitochondrial enoyl-[acyl-carrier protein] reductase / trans-2-enoyl-CoA reductase